MEDYIRKMVLSSVLIAFGVAISPFLHFPFLTTKCYPGQHMINVVAGVLLGPLWAALIAAIIGIIRMTLGVGTIYSIPGGIPGGVVVGIFSILFRRMKFPRIEFAAFTEPIGTVLIGGTLSVYVVAPLIGDVKLVGLLIPIWIMFGVSSVVGSVLGFTILKVMSIAGIFREYFAPS